MSEKRLTFSELLELHPAGHVGSKVPYAPTTYTELRAMFPADRPKSPFSDDIDATIALIGESEDPDSIVAQLPYDEAESLIAFILPPEEQPNE